MIEQVKKKGYHATDELVLLLIKLEELKTFKEIKCLLQDLIEVFFHLGVVSCPRCGNFPFEPYAPAHKRWTGLYLRRCNKCGFKET